MPNAFAMLSRSFPEQTGNVRWLVRPSPSPSPFPPSLPPSPLRDMMDGTRRWVTGVLGWKWQEIYHHQLAASLLSSFRGNSAVMKPRHEAAQSTVRSCSINECRETSSRRDRFFLSPSLLLISGDNIAGTTARSAREARESIPFVVRECWPTTAEGSLRG